MKSLLIIAAVSALVAARPELYKENEDFQYSRSSTDEGSKAGFYGAQRGNMGGNYEKSHNMDGLAQHQMSGAVRQVEGELGEGSNTRTGSVYTAANSRGIYGSGRYDLSNLEGRNFQEGASASDSQAASALSSHNSAYTGSSASHSSGYSSSQAQHSRYQATKNAANSLRTSNIQAAENSQGVGAYDYERQAGYNSGYRSASGYHGAYTNQGASNAQTRLIATAPARVVIRPGATVIVPVAAQTYDGSHIASAYDQNAINSEAEVLSNTNQQTHYRPANSAKHYESAYSYRKEWEKHNTVPSAAPLAIPTIDPLSVNSELYDDTQALHTSDGHYASGIDSHSSHSSNAHSGYNSDVNSASSSQSRYRSGYNAQLSNTAARINSDAHTHGAYNTGNAADANVIGDTNTPKSYQSSYSYHKSWERQGDPYVIYPSVAPNSGNGPASQRLTDASDSRQGYQSHQYGSQARHSHQSYTHGSAVDCDENGHIRVARSYNVPQNKRYEDLGQQEQTGWENVQQSQNLEDLGQQSQKLEDLGQYNQNLEDLGQQTQKMGSFGQYSENSEDLGQQTQTLNNFGQQSQNLEDSGQQIQKVERYGQQTQKLDNFGQYSQSSEDLGQQTQSLNNFNQHSQNFENRGQETQQLHHLGQPTRTDLGRQTQDKRNRQEIAGKPKEEDFGQQSQSQFEILEDLGQQVQGPWHAMQDNNNKQQNQSQNEHGQETENSFYQETQTDSNNFQTSNQYLQTSQKENNDQFDTHHSIWNTPEFVTQNTDQKQQGQHEQETQSQTEFGNNFEQQNNWHHITKDQNEDLGQQTQDSWSTLDTLNQNKTVDNNDQVKPVWEQSEDNSQQTTQNTGSGTWTAINNNEQGHRWNYINKQNRDSSNQQTQSAYGDVHSFNSNKQNRSNQLFNTNDFNSNNSHTNTGSGSSLQSLWDKINNFDQVTSLSTNNNHNESAENRNYFLSNHSISQNSDQNNWRQYNSESSSVNSQNSYQNNQYGTHYAGSRPWMSSVSNEGTISSNTTVKPKDNLETSHGETSQNSYQGNEFGSHYVGYHPRQSTVLHEGTITTAKPKDDLATHNVENLSPDEIGRGDIGPEDSVAPLTSTTDKSYSTIQNKQNSPIFISDVNINRYKTPEEIETLSLTKETNRTINYDKNHNKQNTQVFNEDKKFQEDHVLNVLSISEQKLLEEQKNREESQNSASNRTIVISNTPPKSTISNHYYANTNHETNEQRETQQYESQSELGISTYHHKPINQEPASQFNPSDKINNTPTNVGFEQGPEEIEQQNTEQQFEELGNFGQHSENLNQQSQTAWEQDLKDLGQQVQPGWRPNEDLQQQSDTQQFENFGRSYQGQYQTQDFYNQKPVVEKEQQRTKAENLQTAPDSTQKEEKVQLAPQNKDVEIISPLEPSTEKPGFWKSVGNKFSNAKDKVASWFKS